MKIGNVSVFNEGYLASGLSEARRGLSWRVFSKGKRRNFLSNLTYPPRGRPAGGGGFIPNGGMGVSTPIMVPEFTDFHGKTFRDRNRTCEGDPLPPMGRQPLRGKPP